MESINSELMRLYYDAFKEYPNAATLVGKTDIIETFEIGNTTIKRTISLSINKQNVCCMLTTTPSQTGDGTNIVNEFIMTCLLSFKNITAHSSIDGPYLSW